MAEITERETAEVESTPAPPPPVVGRAVPCPHPRHNPKALHGHQCKGCGLIHFHPNEMRGNEEAHKCPNCGKVEWQQVALPTFIPQPQERSGFDPLNVLLWVITIVSGALVVYRGIRTYQAMQAEAA